MRQPCSRLTLNVRQRKMPYSSITLFCMNQQDDKYITAWRTYRRIARFGLILVPGLWLCMVLIGWYVPDSIGVAKLIIIGIIAFFWALSGLVILALLYGFECPRCKELFFVTGFFRLDTFTSHCRHCGLKKWDQSKE